jgi:hypothetical protein
MIPFLLAYRDSISILLYTVMQRRWHIAIHHVAPVTLLSMFWYGFP